MIGVKKEVLRKEMFERRQNLSYQERKHASENVCNQLIEIVNDKKPKSVHCFIPMGNEIDVRSFIEYCLAHSIVVVCPKTLKKTQLRHLVLSNLSAVEKGIFGTVYPSGNKQFIGDLDIIIVPGLAYDLQGGRLGYGGGYYDTFLENQPNAVKIGVGFQCQVVDVVPIEEHDVPLDMLLTF